MDCMLDRYTFFCSTTKLTSPSNCIISHHMMMVRLSLRSLYIPGYGLNKIPRPTLYSPTSHSLYIKVYLLSSICLDRC